MGKIIEASDAAPEKPSIDPDEVAKFSAIAAEWWDPKGKFRPLHRFNPVRLGFIRNQIIEHFGKDGSERKPFKGLRLLDIGCGGGLVSEPIARVGADVTGVDASPENIKTALTHADEVGLKIDYRAGTAEGLLANDEEKFDVVLNLEVVEHVADAKKFIEDTAHLVAPGGIMIVATINRTAKAWALAIVGAEYILRWLPQGTHDFDKLVTPEEIRGAVTAAGMNAGKPIGVSFNPIADQWRLSNDSKVNYMMVATRPAS